MDESALFKGETDRFLPFALFCLTLVVLLFTLAPTVQSRDSAELTTGAATLGIVHAPGYPLYLLVGHVFTKLPMGDVAWRVNFFSALCLAGCAPLFYGLLLRLLGDWLPAAAATLSTLWTPYLWHSGTVAEIYAPQLFSLALVLYVLSIVGAQHVAPLPSRDTIYGVPTGLGRVADTAPTLGLIAVLGGIALALHPASLLFAPAILLMLYFLKMPWRWIITVGVISLVIVALSWLYFPLRAEATFNMAGTYSADGSFQAVNLRSPEGVLWMVRGAQFGDQFFAEGYGFRIGELAGLLWENFILLGVLWGILGLWQMLKRARGIFACWLLWLLPYSYFYLNYGVADRSLMLLPVYAAWGVTLGYGLQLILPTIEKSFRPFLAFSLPIILLVINFPLTDQSDAHQTRQHSEAWLRCLPADAAVIADWDDIMPLYYLQQVEKQRPDLTLYNLFLFPPTELNRFLTTPQRPIALLGGYVDNYFPLAAFPVTTYTLEPEKLHFYLLSPQAVTCPSDACSC